MKIHSITYMPSILIFKRSAGKDYITWRPAHCIKCRSYEENVGKHHRYWCPNNKLYGIKKNK
jgi:hypothetical protein